MLSHPPCALLSTTPTVTFTSSLVTIALASVPAAAASIPPDTCPASPSPTHPRPLPLSPTRRARTTSIHVQLTASTHHPSTNQPYAYRYTLALPSAFHHRHHLSLTLTPPRLSFTTARRRIYGGLAGGYAIATSLQSWVRALHSLCGAATRISLMCLLLAEAARSAGDSHPLATCSAVRSSSRRTTKMAAVS